MIFYFLFLLWSYAAIQYNTNHDCSLSLSHPIFLCNIAQWEIADCYISRNECLSRTLPLCIVSSLLIVNKSWTRVQTKLAPKFSGWARVKFQPEITPLAPYPELNIRNIKGITKVVVLQCTEMDQCSGKTLFYHIIITFCKSFASAYTHVGVVHCTALSFGNIW